VNRSTIIAAAILAAIVLYFGARSLMRGSIGSENAPVASQAPADVTDAIVLQAASEPHELRIIAKAARRRTNP